MIEGLVTFTNRSISACVDISRTSSQLPRLDERVGFYSPIVAFKLKIMTCVATRGSQQTNIWPGEIENPPGSQHQERGEVWKFTNISSVFGGAPNGLDETVHRKFARGWRINSAVPDSEVLSVICGNERNSLNDHEREEPTERRALSNAPRKSVCEPSLLQPPQKSRKRQSSSLHDEFFRKKIITSRGGINVAPDSSTLLEQNDVIQFVSVDGKQPVWCARYSGENLSRLRVGHLRQNIATIRKIADWRRVQLMTPTPHLHNDRSYVVASGLKKVCYWITDVISLKEDPRSQTASNGLTSHISADSIDNNLVSIGSIRQQASELLNGSRGKDDLATDPRRIKLFFNGMELRDDARDAGHSGLRSEVVNEMTFLVISEDELLQELEQSQKRTCILCVEDFHISAFPTSITAKCAHQTNTCIPCLQYWIAAELDRGGLEAIKCSECPEPLQHGDIKCYATEDVYERYDRLATRAILNAIPNFRWCLRPGCESGQIHVTGDDGPIFKCCDPNCGFRFCVTHSMPWHEGETCAEYDYRTHGRFKDDEASVKTIQEVCKICPKCNSPIEKNGGCDHMTCLKCKDEFCWECLAPYSEIRRRALPGQEITAAQAAFFARTFYDDSASTTYHHRDASQSYTSSVFEGDEENGGSKGLSIQDVDSLSCGESGPPCGQDNTPRYGAESSGSIDAEIAASSSSVLLFVFVRSPILTVIATMAKTFDAAEVARHNKPDDCWVCLYGDVWDVTEFLPSHPGGSSIILKLAGRDATEDYDPVHPPGTLESNLPPSKKLGKIDPATLPKPEVDGAEKEQEKESPPDMKSLLNLDEIEEVATKQISKKCWAYYYSAGDDLISKNFNNTVYKQILLRPRVFVDCTKCDVSTTLLGHKVGLPLYVSPAAMARLAHPAGEHGIAQGISQFGAMQIVSNNASMTPEQIVEGSLPGQIFGWQLYVQNERKKSEDMLVRINKMSDKYKFICLTLDAPVPGKREHDEKSSYVAASLPVTSAVKAGDEKKGPGGGVGQQLFWGTAADLTWKTTLTWLAKHTSLPIVLKGIQTHEDAYLAAQYAPQVKAIILSNHGGRALDTAPPAVHTLLEIRKYCPEVFSRIEVWVDGGIKRGTDVVKALCLGAKAVGVGRAALFGLGAGGAEGVERTFEILKAEIDTCMRLLGVEKVSDLSPKHINSRAVERDVYDGHAGLEKLGLWCLRIQKTFSNGTSRILISLPNSMWTLAILTGPSSKTFFTICLNSTTMRALLSVDQINRPYLLFFLLLYLAGIPTSTFAQTQGNYTSLSEAFWQLSDLTFLPASALHRKPELGGQNFTHCCLLAVNASLYLDNGYIKKVSEPGFIKATVDELISASNGGQFPCTATWNGDYRGAPVVEVPASWLESTCPGWQLSDSKQGDENQWVAPFVGFLLPAVVFCLTIPRRRKIAVWKKLFVQDLSQVVSWILAPFAMILAGLFVCTDTIIWLCTCFAFASPMILSGFYEAYLDQKIISFLMEKTNNFRLTLDMKARLLFVILVGNLDLEPEPIEGDLELIVMNNKHQDDNDRWPNEIGTEIRNPSSPWTHIENLVHPLRSYRDNAIGTPRQWPLHDVQCSIPDCTDLYCKEIPLQRTPKVRKEIGRTKTRLRTMLSCQYSFGSTVGAPVIFFLGAFGFTLVTTLALLGDQDTSLDLAFGMWYMIIPHISIVSGLLLAGNNPNTLEGVVALEFGDVEESGSAEKGHIGNQLFELAYDSRYKPKWLWMRGRSKKDWIEKVCKTYEMRPPSGRRGSFVQDEDMTALREATTMTIMSWAIVLSLTLLLSFIPFVLAFLTGFYTPQVGISCRSFTFLIYAISQLCQIVLWMWAYAGAPCGKYLFIFKQGGFLDQKGFYNPTNLSSLFSKETFWSFKSLWAIIWYNLAVIFGLGGVITSIGGTMMQLMGVYTSDKCSINAEWWTRPHDDVQVVISTNYALEIADARRYWVPCAITAIMFLGPLKLLATPFFLTKKTDPFTKEASHMTLSHNSIIRGYNSIYQQAPRIAASDYRDFVGYCLAWHRFVEGHHAYEEIHFFPAIEKATGEKGVMDGEVDQHATFHGGLASFKDYLANLKNPEKNFKALQLLGIMDSFAEALYSHLAAEPQSLLNLSRLCTAERQFDLAAIAAETGKRSVTLEFAFNVLPIFLGNMETVEFEDGMWQNFPDVPAPVRWIMKNILPLWNRRQWRFMSCSRDGRRKPLIALVFETIFLFLTPILSQSPPQPENIKIKGTTFLDHETLISQFFGKTFLRENVPFIDIPDKQIQDVYYYRWSSLQRHLRYTIAGTGYILTEFVQPVGYAQALNTIDAAAGHQIDETRWLRSNFYNEDYIQVYTRGPGNTVQYTHWILDALYRRASVNGDEAFANGQLDDMIRLWGEWDYTFDSGAGLYYFTPNFDAQEYSLPGYVVAPSGNNQLQLDGPNTYRPSHNAYMAANARAIAAVAAASKNTAVASNFTGIADRLEAAMYKRLWDSKQQFFVDVIRDNNPNLTPVTGREEVGFYPFRFGIGLNSTYNKAALQAFDPQGFQASFGPTTLEIRNQYFFSTKPSDYCCFWNGQSWPFSTAHTLKSLAAIYRSGQSSITADQYVQSLKTYAATQQKNGVPYVAESHYPFTDSWSADSSNHSEHYDHSTNNDDVITGLLGIVPRSDAVLEISPIIPANWTYFAIENVAYHGHLVTVLYDADGTRYKCGGNLCVYVDGEKKVAETRKYPFTETVPLATAPIVGAEQLNIAANPNGLGYYPTASATYTYVTDNPYKVIDGYLFYDSVPDSKFIYALLVMRPNKTPDRWTNYQSPSSNDTLQVTFARPRNISSVTLALFSDVARGGAVDVPSAIEIYGSSGLLTTITNSSSFLPNDRNTFSFNPTQTTFIAVSMHNKPNVFVGVCELEVWTPFVLSPYFYAVDALLTNAQVVFDKKSNATSNGAVVAASNSNSVAGFSGDLPSNQKGKLGVYYANSGTSVVQVKVMVNQVVKMTLSLGGTGGEYKAVLIDVELPSGKNFISLVGGGNGLTVEMISLEGSDPGH
ncbi:hypothetical protein G7Y89_g2641 [Cudoniella acicularis]|uniref:L-lactate dehydrogenase (cytochrome) n=1 Tax=Cudoniella acicularis TaxID=354080 RepID=A0A8H4RSX8_9HELO|nr:hypothetical protein G7Y89_g2641 [Cudoniella acicularis]